MPCDGELLFHTSNGTPWDTNLVVKRKLYPVLDRLGIARAGMHAFRHGNATVMDQLEVPTKVRQSRLGHADIATTMGYTHVVTTDDRKAAAELERIIFGSVQAKTEHKTWQVAQGNA
jgi:integrase